MSRLRVHSEHHLVERIGWLRAAVLGANDGIVSTASIVVGVAAADSSRSAILLAGIAGMVAGAMSMAAGEYVSVSSQSDAEESDRKLELKELAEQPELELQELAQIYVNRGLDADLARQVAEQITRHDALGAHLRDELGQTHVSGARPVQAALTSAASFAAGAALPLLVAGFVEASSVPVSVSLATLVSLAVLGSLSAYAGGASLLRGALRVMFWGALALALTAAVGRLVGTTL
jgi:VIT1/CCC1 family predicted Fe2+/Mn2+ transporter